MDKFDDNTIVVLASVKQHCHGCKEVRQPCRGETCTRTYLLQVLHICVPCVRLMLVHNVHRHPLNEFWDQGGLHEMMRFYYQFFLAVNGLLYCRPQFIRLPLDPFIFFRFRAFGTGFGAFRWNLACLCKTSCPNPFQSFLPHNIFEDTYLHLVLPQWLRRCM